MPADPDRPLVRLKLLSSCGETRCNEIRVAIEKLPFDVAFDLVRRLHRGMMDRMYPPEQYRVRTHITLREEYWEPEPIKPKPHLRLVKAALGTPWLMFSNSFGASRSSRRRSDVQLPAMKYDPRRLVMLSEITFAARLSALFIALRRVKRWWPSESYDTPVEAWPVTTTFLVAISASV